MSDLLRVAVVGHTNTGKTSLLRTLARDAQFGEVADSPGTTRRVKGIALLVDGAPAMEFLDTPGLEDSVGLLEHLDALRPDRRSDGPERIVEFLASPEAGGRFAPEAAALRAVLACQTAIYVIDVRDRVLAKHRDELEILARCGRPVVPVLNFVAAVDQAGPGHAARDIAPRTAEWRDLLARVNLHAVVEFDAVVFDEVGEIRLFEKLQTLLDAHRAILQRLIDDRRDRARTLRRRAGALIAALLVEAALMVELVDRADGAAGTVAEARLRDRLRQAEQRCTDGLLSVFGFTRDDVIGADLPLVEGRWGIDLFSRAALRRYGIGAGGGAAAGAATGVGIDLVLGGMTLGAAAALGAAVGGVAGALGLSGGKLVRKVRGGDELRVGDRTLRLLGLRQMELAAALLRRGHAAMRPVRMAAGAAGHGQRGSSSVEDDVRRSAGDGRVGGGLAGGAESAGERGRRAVDAAIGDVIAMLRESLPESPISTSLPIGRAFAGSGGLSGLGAGHGVLGPTDVVIRKAALRLVEAMESGAAGR